MESSLYVQLSGQLSLERRMETVARNVANMDTAGYRADAVKFNSEINRAGADPVAYASTGDNYINRQGGPIKQTGNPLDVAVAGNGWLGIETGNGPAYTRDGRMQISVDGLLRSVEGNPILDAGGGVIALDPAGGQPEILRDGSVFQNGQRVAVIGLFDIPEGAKLSRLGGSAVVPNQPAQPIFEFTENGLEQGYVEGSNVNPIMEISRLIEISRAFESTNSAMQTAESARQNAIRQLGG
ncbi:MULTISPECIES: flagellar basal-body rod protein FlgF [Pseudovibrio]|uniref:flagellar basal-body rod protein FlgF n=1 Tax=Stappiaceae TaxID=2821832 RepID=UPI0023669644|nr:MULTISPECIES: flagellar basal-body rod protein FlgF [Pseudovibrio]MDD7909029.1 flagellar basal-body rod protein FlgF [Pseudovibrio exalbescens]MDX5593650.1 flagellar basal-body rod protein FlgF [Pseudovibrio sp. SPO723]